MNIEPSVRGFIAMTVTDVGIGMIAELIGRVGDFFPPPARLGTEGEPGTGFGLTLVKTLALRLGGRFELISQVGQGTTAKLWLQEARAHG